MGGRWEGGGRSYDGRYCMGLEIGVVDGDK